MGSYHLYRASRTLRSASADLETMHGPAYILSNICLCDFNLRISMNYMKNVMELHTHAQTVDIPRHYHRDKYNFWKVIRQTTSGSDDQEMV